MYHISYKINNTTTISYDTNYLKYALRGVMRYVNKGVQVSSLTIVKRR